MNNIYVDELPTKGACIGGCPYAVTDTWVSYCPFQQEENGDHLIIEEDCIKACPLKLVTDRLAEERKKVCEQIYKLFTNESMWKSMKDWWLNNGNCRELKQILDAVENGMENKEIIEKFSKDREYYALFNKLKEENNG